jgi:phospholipid/cholesterol/gamma-HCH transport system substrate-binding protein
MKFSIRYSDQVVGTLVIVGLAIMVFVIFMLGTTQRWFKRDVQYFTYHTSASGLNSGMPISYKGFTIGQVRRISLAEDEDTKEDRVKVLFNIFEEYIDKVKIGSLVEIQVSPIGLGSSVILYPGIGPTTVAEGMLIPEINSREALALKSRGLAGPRDPSTDGINAIVNQVTTLLETINYSLGSKSEDEEPPLTKIVNDITQLIGDLSETIGPILANLNTLSAQIAAPSGTVGKILDGQGPFYRSLEQALVSIAGIIKDLERTIEFIPAQLPQVTTIISQLNALLVDVHKTIIAVNNNPLLRGGIPDRQEFGPGGASPRNENF